MFVNNFCFEPYSQAREILQHVQLSPLYSFIILLPSVDNSMCLCVQNYRFIHERKMSCSEYCQTFALPSFRMTEIPKNHLRHHMWSAKVLQ